MPEPTDADIIQATKILCDIGRMNIFTRDAIALATTRQAAEVGQRERDAKVAEDVVYHCSSHYTVGHCKHDATGQTIASAIRATGGGSQNG